MEVQEGSVLQTATSERVRINIKTTAAGAAQFDITAEFPSARESGIALRQAIDEFRDVCLEKGLKIAGQ